MEACCSKTATETMDAKAEACAHNKEGPEFEALKRRVEQLEMLVRFLLSQPSRPYPPNPIPMGEQIRGLNTQIDLSQPPERSISGR